MAYRRRRFKRKLRKYLKRTYRSSYGKMTARSVGRSVNVRLCVIADVTTGTNGAHQSVTNVNYSMRLANDWAFFRDSYELVNIYKVKLRFHNFNSNTNQYNNIWGGCYSIKDNAVLGQTNQISDHANYLLMSSQCTQKPGIMKFKPRPNQSVPIGTAASFDSDTRYGWIKLFATGVTASFKLAMIEFIYYCSFSSQS